MKNFIFSILILGFITSCSKFPDPSFEIISGYSIYPYGSEQRGLAGEFLKDSLVLQISGQRNITAGMKVEFSVMTGGGELSNPVTIVDQGGNATTHWKTGFETNQQVVKASVYDLNGKFLTSSNFISYAFKPNSWDTLVGQPDANMWDLAADTINDMTFMCSNGQVFRQTNIYFNWEMVGINQSGSLNGVEVDSHGIIFACNSNGEVYFSTDKGYSWDKCNKPFPGYQGFIVMFVSNNDWVWASTGDKKLVYSKDHGSTWTDASGGLSDGDGLGEIYRHPDGTLFFRATYPRLYKSDDDGKNWTLIPKAVNIYEIYMQPNGDILTYSPYYSQRIMKSTDKCQNFTELYSVITNTSMSGFNFFNYYKGTYYILIPGKGIIRTTDMIHFEDYWNNPDIFNLFIDHNGVMIAKGNQRIFYRHNL